MKHDSEYIIHSQSRYLLLSPVSPGGPPNNPLVAELLVVPPDIDVRNKTWLPSHVIGVFTRFFIVMPQLVLPASKPTKQTSGYQFIYTQNNIKMAIQNLIVIVNIISHLILYKYHISSGLYINIFFNLSLRTTN